MLATTLTLIGCFYAHILDRTNTLWFVIAAITLLVGSFVQLAPSMHCRRTESKAKCTSCVSLHAEKVKTTVVHGSTKTLCNKGW